MLLTAVIRWLPNQNNPLIQFMMLDEAFNYLIQPSEIQVKELEKDLSKIFTNFDKKAVRHTYCLKYKSVTLSFGRHRKDSAAFHRLINQLAKARKVDCDRKMRKLTGDALKQFKQALKFLDIDIRPAYIVQLWAIALKVESRERSVKKGLEQLWKKKESVNRLDTDLRESFNEFLTAVGLSRSLI